MIRVFAYCEFHNAAFATPYKKQDKPIAESGLEASVKTRTKLMINDQKCRKPNDTV